MSQDQSARVLLQIKNQNIKNLAVKESSDGVLRVTADLSYAITLCPRCGQAEITRNGFKQVVARLPRVR